MVQSVPPRAHPRDQMREERLEILGMLEAGGISVEEAATLLEALDRRRSRQSATERRRSVTPKGGRCVSA